MIASIIRRWPKAVFRCSQRAFAPVPSHAANMIANEASLQIAPMSPRWLAMRSNRAATPRRRCARGGGFDIPRALLDRQREGYRHKRPCCRR